MPSIIARGSKLSHNSLSWQKVDVLKIGSAELLFQVKPHIISLESLCSENRPRKWRQKPRWGLSTRVLNLLEPKNICVEKIGFGNKEKKLRWGLSTRVLNLLEQKNICVEKIGFGNEKKLRWGLSTRVLNYVGGTKKNNNNNIGPFPQGGFEKPNPARTKHTRRRKLRRPSTKCWGKNT